MSPASFPSFLRSSVRSLLLRRDERHCKPSLSTWNEWNKAEEKEVTRPPALVVEPKGDSKDEEVREMWRFPSSLVNSTSRWWRVVPQWARSSFLSLRCSWVFHDKAQETAGLLLFGSCGPWSPRPTTAYTSLAHPRDGSTQQQKQKLWLKERVLESVSESGALWSQVTRRPWEMKTKQSVPCC